MRLSIRLAIIPFSVIMMVACSTPNPQAPMDNQVHPSGYVLAHATEASADLTQCTICHGADFTGGTNAVSCVTCHPNAPDFSRHGLPYQSAAAHGPSARLTLRSCLACHGTAPNLFTGGIVADPALFNRPNGTCTTCHTSAGAHPTNWQGTNEDDDVTYDSSHRGVTTEVITTSCALCHKVDGPGIGPVNTAPSCYTASYTNADGVSTGCHAAGPGGSAHDLPYATAQAHGTTAAANLAACQVCHGQTGTTDFSGGLTGVGCDTAGCHPDAGAHPTNWQGTNDTTGDYLSSHQTAGNMGVACALCHDYTEGRTAPNPSAPSCFSADFTNANAISSSCHSTGPGVPHALPFLDGGLHGPEAKADLSSCVPCHAVPVTAGAGDNPRFNVPRGDMTNGCEDCHAPFTAHPTPVWAGGINNDHRSPGNPTVACALCHGTGLDGPAGGGVGPACTDCHTVGSPLTLTDCTSCHNSPPDGRAPAGNASPNIDGAHVKHETLAGVTGVCATCHTGAGTGNPGHYDTAAPADVAMAAAYDAKSGSAGYNASAGTCSNVSCHGGNTTPNWATGRIDVATDCTSCHASGTSQYNGYHSGQHNRHLSRGLRCTDCHDPNRLAATHFTDLISTDPDGDPGDSIRASFAYNTSTNSGCNVSGCHGSERW